MKDIILATCQFEHRSNDKAYNLLKIEQLSTVAKNKGARAVSFHELCISGYGFLKDSDETEVSEVSEDLNNSPSLRILQQVSGDLGIIIMAGLVERHNGKYYNSYVAVENEKVIARFSKLHPFISRYLSPGNKYVFFKIDDWICSMLICYDNNIIENVRAVTLEGAQILFAPHVTGGTPSPMPGRGFIDPDLWENRDSDKEAIMREINGPKGRDWLMKWLPARAFDNGIYVIFSNSVGMDYDHVKNGNAMIIDPFGNILSEATGFNDQVVVAIISPGKLEQAGGYRYRNARRPELYKHILSKDNDSYTKPIWLK